MSSPATSSSTAAPLHSAFDVTHCLAALEQLEAINPRTRFTALVPGHALWPSTRHRSAYPGRLTLTQSMRRRHPGWTCGFWPAATPKFAALPVAPANTGRSPSSRADQQRLGSRNEHRRPRCIAHRAPSIGVSACFLPSRCPSLPLFVATAWQASRRSPNCRDRATRARSPFPNPCAAAPAPAALPIRSATGPRPERPSPHAAAAGPLPPQRGRGRPKRRRRGRRTWPRAPQCSPSAPQSSTVHATPAPDLLAAYRQRLTELLAGPREYPRIAALRGWEGEVRLRLRVARKGNLVGVVLDRSSGFDVLDQHALAMLAGLGSLPPLPEGLEGSEIQIVVPVSYKLNKTT